MSSSRRSRSRRWKRLLGNVIVVGLGVMALLLLVGLFLPRTFVLQRSVEIRGQPEAVYAKLSALRQWPEWTVWNTERDPGLRFEYGTPDSGVGAMYRWNGPKVGRGQLKLTRAEPEHGVWYDLDLEGGQMTATGSLTFERTPQGVKVVWLNEGNLGRNPVSRYVGLFMDHLAGPDFEGGLARLRTQVEAAAAPQPTTPAQPSSPSPAPSPSPTTPAAAAGQK